MSEQTRSRSEQNRPSVPRRLESHEFVPENYFERVSKSVIFPESQKDTPLEIDLGCGDGSFLLALAARHPERCFLGVERLLGRVRKVSRKARKAALANLKVLRLESRYTVEWLVQPSSVRRLHLLCPDPWPKVRHHRRRLVRPDFLAVVHRVLEPGGEFLFMTDHPEYFDWAESSADLCETLERIDWPEDAFFHPKTDFQIQWESEGRTLQRLRLRKSDGSRLNPG